MTYLPIFRVSNYFRGPAATYLRLAAHTTLQ